MRSLIDLSVALAEGKTSWIQIMRTGSWEHPQYGDMKITDADLHKFKENFDNNVRGVKLFVDLNHDENHAAYGEYKAVKVEDHKLFAEIAWTDEGQELIKSGKYRYFSPEFMFDYDDPETGKKFEDVLLGGALTNRPFLKGMAPVALAELEKGETVMFADDPDHDGDDDSTTNPKSNPDWMQDVVEGITRWPNDAKQQKVLTDAGHTKEKCDAVYERRHQTAKMSESEFKDFLITLAFADDVTNAHKSPPAGKPKDKGQYADPAHFKYPIDDAGHIQSAMGYYNVAGNKEKGGYTDAQWDAIGRKIAAAANAQFGPGHELKDGKIVTPSNHSKMTEDADEGDNNPSDGAGDSTPGPINDVDGGDFSDPQHKDPKPKGANKMDPKTAKMNEPATTVSLAEFQAQQQKVQLLEKQLRRASLSEKVDGLIYNAEAKVGHLAPAQRDEVVAFMEGLDDEQVTKFEELMAKSPAVIQYGERGFSASNETKQDRTVLLSERAKKYMSEGKSMSEAHALAEADIEAAQKGAK